MGICKKDLHKDPQENLFYVDLKFVITQPRRYEQFQQEFDLSKAKEECWQLLEKESERPDHQEAMKAIYT